VPKRIAAELARSDYEAQRLRGLEGAIGTTAQQHDATPLDVLQTLPGLGKLLRLVLLDAIHAIARCPRVRACVSSCRLVHWAQASAGPRDGTSGPKLGTAHLQGAFSEAAGLVLRTNPAGPQALARFESKPGQGQAFTVLAQARRRPHWGTRGAA
jgi:transposase